MITKRLWVNEAPDDPSLKDIVWRRAADGPSSLHTNIDPDLARLGNVRAANRDGHWLANTVLLTDRTSPRRKGWERDLGVTVPVSDPDCWEGTRDALEETLSFLSSDTWVVDFVVGPELAGNRAGGNHPGTSHRSTWCVFSAVAPTLCAELSALWPKISESSSCRTGTGVSTPAFKRDS